MPENPEIKYAAELPAVISDDQLVDVFGDNDDEVLVAAHGMMAVSE